MMRMKEPQASGRASALRVNRKTRPMPCRIAVRADIEKSVHSKENQPRFGAIWTSLSSARRQILRFGPKLLRFSENRTLKTENQQHRCGLLSPYAACRCNSTGLLEQMP